MKPKINFLEETESPIFSVVTPLRVGDSVSNQTLESVRLCKLPFNWITVESDNNVMKNFDIGITHLLTNNLLSDYVIKIDNDTDWEENTLEEMVNSLQESEYDVGYVYCSFKYTGNINDSFPAKTFDIVELKKGNFISSNSMFKTCVIQQVGLVTDDYYIRLLDWAFLLKCFFLGYKGQPCKGHFTAHSSPTSISARSREDYELKKSRVVKNFIK